MNRLLQRSSWRYFLRHPWLFGLSILGVALGVAVVVAVDIANVSAERAFELSARRVTGQATHHVVGTAGSLSDTLYHELRVDHGIRPSAPVIEGYGRIPGVDRPLEILGIDPFADGPFRPYVGMNEEMDLAAFMARGPTALLPTPTARQLNVGPGDTLQLAVDGREVSVTVAGRIEPADDYSREALSNFMVVDISTAQDLLGMQGELSRIDLILPDGERGDRVTDSVEELLPAGAQLVRSSARTQTVQQMTEAFELNLSALSLLALIVGMFLIYNMMTFSVVQRRTLLGRLRALGLTQRELFLLIVGEAAVVGLIGTLIGVLLGWLLATVLVELVTRTINDLYYVVTVRQLTLSGPILAKGIGLGLGATVAAAAVPAIEAATAPIRHVLQRSQEESSMRRYIPRLCWGGGVFAAVAVALMSLPGQNILVSYVALFLVLLAFALVTPAIVVGFARIVRPVMHIGFGILGRMAARGLVTALSRTAVAIAALSIAVAATIGVAVMVDSFRSTVVVWLDYTLQADVYVEAPSTAGRRSQTTLDPRLVEEFQQVSGIVDAHTIRRLEVASELGRTNLAAVDPSPRTRRTIRFKETASDDVWQTLPRGRRVLLSEPYAYRHDLEPGDSLELSTRRGPRPFYVSGIYYDYGSEMGTVMMSRQTFENYYDDPGAAGLALYVGQGVSVEEVISRLRALDHPQQVEIRSNRNLRRASLQIFDRTFRITTVLRLLAIIVAFVGVLTALMALQLERSREVGVLRATGMTPGQLGRYVSLQTGLMGLLSGLLAIPLGLLMALVLVFAINKRSFGWTLQFSVAPEILLQGVLLALVAALLAGAYPAWKMASTEPAEVLRE